ncbi:unnamed protein product [Dracunculus medinensis]|uniref:RING-type domain-containing protein n=1 Tax=Dracunculus medinensis TaxID=318479 RepID=A0A0N4UM11_DRAME|nr:unnamed protein product [Dracunculus medinensis]
MVNLLQIILCQELELWLNEPRFEVNWLRQQIVPCHDREPSYLSTDTSGINAMLNHEDVSEYLKIGTNGLEARCDASSFESVRCTFEAVDGVWFYEALILTAGVMQIGFATKQSRFCNHEGYGIGDDEYSLAYDGCRQLLWHNAQFEKHEHKPWNAGDYLGCLLDIPGCFVQFYLNGQPLQNPHRKFMERRMTNFDSGIFAAASFMSFQQCRFNFGHHPFRYPPLNIEFKTFNEYGVLTEEQKTILPRRAKMELISNMIISDENCHICYTDSMDTVLEPCGHGAICFHCSNQIRQCPLCRVDISGRVRIAKKQSVISLERSFTYLMGMNSNEPISTMEHTIDETNFLAAISHYRIVISTKYGEITIAIFITQIFSWEITGPEEAARNCNEI